MERLVFAVQGTMAWWDSPSETCHTSRSVGLRVRWWSHRCCFYGRSFVVDSDSWDTAPDVFSSLPKSIRQKAMRKERGRNIYLGKALPVFLFFFR